MKKTYKNALKKKQIKAFAQIIVNKNGETVGAEALARWELPDGALLSPARFVEEMVALNIISELDYYMFEELLKHQSMTDCFLTCNFTRQTLSQVDFTKRISDIANKYDVDFSNIVLEITEVVSESDKLVAIKNVAFCRELGMLIAIDDIQTGVATIEDVDSYAADIVKIDRTAILEALDANDLTPIKAIITKAHSFGAKVIAEGIETKEMADMLFELGADYLQGYYFGKPAPIENITK